ncbi:MAG: PAS domain S-box protein [Chloroflexi bacterium]|nr:PAS domain S-box protein [Chloroflexota bacterium]
MTQDHPTTSEEQARLLLDQSPDAMILANREGIIREWNAAATRIFGHPRETALHQNLDLIIPERFREAHWRGYDRALAEGRTKYEGRSMPTRSMRADGSTIYVEFSFGMIEDGGAIVGVLATARDITERFEHERTERARVRALEERVSALDSMGDTGTDAPA